jgi:hypothetical protein
MLRFGALLQPFAIFVMAGVVTSTAAYAGDAYLKSRAKALNNVSDRVNHYVINDPSDLAVSKNGLKLQQHIGLDVSKRRGYAPTLNYGEIKNVILPNKISVATPFRSKGLLSKPSGYGENLGTLTNCHNSAKVENYVEIKNAQIGGAILGDNVNVGVLASDCKNGGQLNIKNTVTVKDSRVGGAKGIVTNR